MNEIQKLLRQLPAVDRLLHDPALQSLEASLPHVLIREAAQQTVDQLRRRLLERPDTAKGMDLSPSTVARQAARTAAALAAPSLRQVINATGTLLHTNLGRAPLSDRALAAIHAVARGYSNLEFDLADGERGHRFSHVEELICRLTGAEAAAVVNNNAGAVLLALAALAQGKEAIVSRGELVEIGGAFRVPEVMAASGVLLREVGTTNKTHLHDYRKAIGPESGLLLKVHTSNYRIVGFTDSVPAADLVTLGREHGLPVLEDLGSGMLLDLSSFGVPREPTVYEAVAAGIDVVTFSGDKLLGGPQAGILVGKKATIERLRNHPMARALRIDKLTLAALEATLQAYLDPRRALNEIPVLRLLQIPAAELKKRCRRLAKRIESLVGEGLRVDIVPETSRIGGGAMPLCELPGFALALHSGDFSAVQFAARLRAAHPPVIGRIQEERLLLNPRTILPHEEKPLLASLQEALGGDPSASPPAV